jgi:hypothetical protein
VILLNNDEKELIGLPGIDTDYERNQLEYRPHLAWQRPELQSDWGAPLPKSQQDELDEFAKPAIGELWDTFVSIVDTLEEYNDELDEKLQHTVAPIPDRFKADVRIAALKYGWIVEDTIPFALYQFALNSKDSIERQWILDAYEGHHADVDGDLRAELYPDVVEMQNDWQDMFNFLNKGVFAQLVSPAYLPKTMAVDDPSMAEIIKQEEEMGEAYKTLVQQKEGLTEILRRAYLHSAPDAEIFSLQKELNKITRIFSDLERRMHTKKQMVELSQSKTRRAITNLDILRYAIDVDHYKDERKNILMSLLKPYATGQPMDKGLRKIQALLKLSIDGKNSTVVDMKTNLRNLSGRENRKRINGALVNGVHLRNEVSGEVLDVMSAVEDAQESYGFNRVAEHIMDSVSVSRGLFKENAGDFYKMHTMESELRSDKISNLMDKDSAREIYKLLSNLIRYGKERNNWPTERDLTAWVDNFLASQKLS